MDKILIAQDLLAKTNYGYNYNAGAGIGFLAFFLWFFFIAAFYAYSALTLMLIAKKTNTPNAWMAWVPILNMYLMCQIAGKSILWFVLLLLPFINIVANVILWAEIAQKRGKPGWWGILMLVPIANFIIMGILAFSGSGVAVQASKSRKSAVFSSAPAKKGMVCPKCGASILSSDKFCPGCGAKVALKKEGRFCPKCGAKIKGADKFCPDCGARV